MKKVLVIAMFMVGTANATPPPFNSGAAEASAAALASSSTRVSVGIGVKSNATGGNSNSTAKLNNSGNSVANGGNSNSSATGGNSTLENSGNSTATGGNSTLENSGNSTATGGNSKNTLTNGNNSLSLTMKEEKNTPNLALSNVQPTIPCAIPVNASGVATAFGLGFGTAYVDKNCEEREVVRLGLSSNNTETQNLANIVLQKRLTEVLSRGTKEVKASNNYDSIMNQVQ